MMNALATIVATSFGCVCKEGLGKAVKTSG
jgi:hypothetical protein